MNGMVNVVGSQAIKFFWKQFMSLLQSTLVVTLVVVCTAGAVDEVPHPNKKISPRRGRRNNFFMRKQEKNKNYNDLIFSSNSGNSGCVKCFLSVNVTSFALGR